MKESPIIIDKLLVKKFYTSFKQKLKLEIVAGEKGLETRNIEEKSINRPALALTGYYKYFGNKRLQLFGAGEMGYLADLSVDQQKEVLSEMATRDIPCIIISRNIEPLASIASVCNQYNIPLICTTLNSKDFSGEATVILENEFAPRLSVHGTLMDIRGMGTLIRGKSGIGKSECALALLERGHSLVADDLTHLRLINDSEVVGFSIELNKGYMECRGIGIIDIANLYGIRSFRLQKRIDLVVTFIEWVPGMIEERTGLDQNFTTLLGIDFPHIEIPVRPGRDMALLVEIASMVQALKKTGHDSAKEFNDRLIAHMAKS